ncbi:MAG: MBL fold metallo-hydrolase [Rhizobiaceae bacterium]|nr:MBL fold metallo-hydrolase [Rhizobiaceae bacterium]
MRTLEIGKFTVDSIVELERVPRAPEWLFPNVTREMVEQHKKKLGANFVNQRTNELYLCFQSFLIRAHGKNILVDSCNGNHKSRKTIPFLDQLDSLAYLSNLARLGLKPDDIDLVCCTHLHTDHVGWNTRLDNGRWVPTFPNAKYLMSAREFDYFKRQNAEDPEKPANHGAFNDSVLPVHDAGLAQLVELAEDKSVLLDEGIELQAAHGHSVGHMAMRLASQGASAILCGDAIHSPIQFLEPQLYNMADLFPEQARQTRHRILSDCAANGSFLLPAHFPSPTAALIEACDNGFACRFVGE